MRPLHQGELASNLEIEIASYRALLDLLRAEQDALRSADAEALPQLSRAKLRQVNALQEFALARSQLLRAASLPETAAGMSSLLSCGSEPPGAGELWKKLLQLAEEARSLNALNGRLALVQQCHFDRAISALLQAAGRLGIYGADGRPQHGASPRALAAI